MWSVYSHRVMPVVIRIVPSKKVMAILFFFIRVFVLFIVSCFG